MVTWQYGKTADRDLGLMEFKSILLTMKLASITTVLLLLTCIPLAWIMVCSSGKTKMIAKAVFNLPLILPPTVLGFYLVMALNPSSPLGSFLERVFRINLLFTFSGLVVASFISGFPFMINSLMGAFQSVPRSLIEASASIGYSPFLTLIKTVLPNSISGILAGVAISFAHTTGEFGVVYMIGGSIPGITRVLSVQIYHEVELLNYSSAHKYAALMLVFSFVLMILISALQKKTLIRS
ncbi:MAG: molybdate ABC transporter permease subunit [Chitinispirillaceae bacterium]